jgi:predicted naringenin-chalcone synthase
MSFVLHGLGTATPPDALTRADAVAVAKVLVDPAVTHWVEDIYAGSGVDTRCQVIGQDVVADITGGTTFTGSPYLLDPARPNGPNTAARMALYAEHAAPLAIRAARAAVAEAGFAPDTFTHLITVSCTGFVSPGVDFALMTALGLPATVERVHVGFMGCHGTLNALRVANAFATADPSARILLAAVELCSLHYYYGADPGKIIANSLFADGAAALVGSGEPVANGLRVLATGSVRIPNSEPDMGWKVGDHGFEMVLTKRIPKLIAAHLKPWLAGWLAKHGLTVETVGGWAVHPGGPKILSAVCDGLGLPDSAVETSGAVLREYGNMSSPTVWFVVDQMRQAGVTGPIVVLGFGPGLVAEAALLG